MSCSFQVYQGWLNKRSEGFLSTYKKKYFILSYEGKESKLYYSQKERSEIIAEIIVSEITQVKWIKENKETQVATQKFNVVTTTKLWELQAQSMPDLIHWLKYIALVRLAQIKFPEDRAKLLPRAPFLETYDFVNDPYLKDNPFNLNQALMSHATLSNTPVNNPDTNTLFSASKPSNDILPHQDIANSLVDSLTTPIVVSPPPSIIDPSSNPPEKTNTDVKSTPKPSDNTSLVDKISGKLGSITIPSTFLPTASSSNSSPRSDNNNSKTTTTTVSATSSIKDKSILSTQNGDNPLSYPKNLTIPENNYYHYSPKESPRLEKKGNQTPIITENIAPQQPQNTGKFGNENNDFLDNTIITTAGNMMEKAKNLLETVAHTISPIITTNSFPGYICDEPEKRICKTMAHRNAQIVTFTRWINYHLNKKNHSITDMNQIADGISLIYLVEELIGEKPPEVIIPITGPRDKIQNISASLQFFSEHLQANLTPISIPLLISGNQKALMDLCWEIIYHHTIKRVCYAGVSDRFGLLRWANQHTANYKSIDIVDFTSSFKDGLAFCALLSDFHPGLIQFDELLSYKVLDNLRLAFKIAEEHYEVPKLLEPRDMIDDPDEIPVIIYLAMCYTNFL